jgi:HTH-type transcriptional regulator/antitoxin PezA
MGLFFYNKIGSIIPMVVLPTTEIIEPKFGAFLCYNNIKVKEDMMIGENIKAVRKSKQLTQPELANLLGISRNSLSRYENGTSAISTELLDRICQTLNVSYVDLVGEEKMLTPVEDYQLTMKVEVLKERGAGILSQLYRYQDNQGIAFDDETNPWILMSDDLSDLINTKIYLIESFDEVERYSGYMDGIERMLRLASQQVVA